jgi:hypothetical protein
MLDFVENNNAFYTAMVDNLEAIKTVQDAMAEVFSNTKLIAEHIKNAADRQVTILNGILNSRDPRNNVTEVVKLGELTTTDPRDSNTTSTYTLSPRDLFREVTDRNSVTTIQPFTQSAQIYGLRQEGNRYVLDSAERDRYIDTRLLPISASNEELINFFVGANGAAPMLSLINFDEGGTMQVGGQMASEVINSSIVTFLQDLRREFEEGEFDANKKAVIINQLESAVAERLSQRLKTDNLQIDFPESEFATGGYTGLGNRIEPVGVVHGGEYVISDNRVTGNRRTLERMQSGENFDEIMGSSPGNFSGGEKIRVVMEFSNTNPSAIISAAKSSMRQLLLSERLI